MSHPAIGRRTSTSEVAVDATHNGRLHVDLKHDLNLQQDDREALDALVEQRPRAGVFVSHAWLTGLFEEPPDGVVPALALIRDGATLRGIAPIGIRQARTVTTVQFLGGGTGSDRVDLLSTRGLEAVCADVLLAWVAESFGSKRFALELRDVPDDSSMWGALARAGFDRTLPLALQPREIHTLPFLPLAGSDADALPPARRQSLEKHRRMLERRGRLRIDLLQDTSDVNAAFESLTGFLHDRWTRGCTKSALDSARAVRFHRRVLPLLAAEGRLRMIRVSSDIRTVAVFYGMAAGSWWGYFLAGYDREWAGRIHLGQLTLAFAIEAALREGATEFDFLKGAERMKYLWPVRERTTIDADVYSSGTGPQLHRALSASRDALAGLVKSVRHLVSA